MAINKVVINTPNGEQTLIDLTGDSVTPKTLALGATAHDASGELIEGVLCPDDNLVREAIPLVSFVDDDGCVEVLTKLKPLSETYGIPFVVAVPSDFVDGSVTAHMNLADLITLEAMGWEISSHAKSHCKLGELTDLEQEEEIGGSKEAFDAMGLHVQTICYPYSSVNESTYKIAKRYFKCGRQTNYKEFINTTPLETWDLRVTPLGSYFESNTSSGLDTSSLAYYKYMVDRAVSENGWLIFLTHCREHNATQQGYLEQVIQYVKSLNIPVVTLSEGLRKRGNIVDSGRYDRRSLYSSEYFVVGCDSKVRQSDNDKYVVKLDTDSVVASTPLTAFPPYAISYCRITGTKHGFPKANQQGGGTLITNTMGFNHDYYPEYRAWQDFILPNGIGTYRRYNQTATAWGEWIDTTPKEYTGITEAEKQEIIDEVVAILQAGETEPELVNLVPTSTDTDGSVFNGTGYQDGKRFSSSGALKDQTGSTATGFIACTATEKLKLTGVKFGGSWNGATSATPNVQDGAGGYCYIMLYNASKQLLTALSYDTYYTGTTYGIQITHGANMSDTTFDLSGYTGEKAKIAYVRINAMGSGANMVVTKK